MMMTDENKSFAADRSAADDALHKAFAALKAADAHADPQFGMRALAAYDDHMRSKRSRLSLEIFAEAFGWRALSRPLAAAGLLLTVGLAGVVTGVMAPESENAVYAELSAAFDEAYDFSEEAVP